MKKKNKHLAAEIGAGAVAAAALAMAGGYVLWERMDKTKKAKVKTWIARARKDAVVKLAHAKHVSEVEYKRIVDQAVKHYGMLSDANKVEIAKAATAMKAEWKRIQEQAKLMAADMQKDAAKRVAGKPAARKTAKTKKKAAKKRK